VDNLPRGDEQDLVLTDAIRRRWLPIVLVTLILATLAGVYAAHRPVTYTSTAKVLLRPSPGNALSVDSITTSQQITVAMTTEAALVTSPDVIDLVNKALHSKLAPGTTTIKSQVATNTEIVVIKYTAPTPAEAEKGANAVATAFLQYRLTRATDTIGKQTKSLQSQLKSAQKSLKSAAVTSIGTNPPPDAVSQVQLYASQVATLQQSIGALQVTDTNPGSVATPASAPSSADGFAPWIYILAAVIVGLGAAILIAIWRARNDQRVHASTLVSVRGRPVLVALPPARGHGQRLIAGADDRDPLRDAYRRARTAVLTGVRRPAVVVVSHVSPVDPEEEVAANLALSLASAGFKVGVVDTRLDGRVPGRFGAGLEPRLPAVLDGLPNRSMPLAREHGVTVVPSDDNPAMLRDRLAGATFVNLLRELRSRSDYVFVTAPAASTADGAAVALAGDHMVLTVVEGVTTRNELHDILDRAERLGIDVVGIIVTPRRRRFLGLPRRPARAGKPANAKVGKPADTARQPGAAVEVPAATLGAGSSPAGPGSTHQPIADRMKSARARQKAGRDLRRRRDAARTGGRPAGSASPGASATTDTDDTENRSSLDQARATLGDSRSTTDGG
jgi:polysaccharide biosynthesis transport protein